MSSRTPHPAGDFGILARVLENGQGKMSPVLARYVLKLGFSQSDQDRMVELAERNQAGELSGIEQAELQEYVRAGHVLALLHSRARKVVRARAQA